MLNINNTLIAGGFYQGGKAWSKKASSLDNCFKLYYIEDGEAIICDKENEFKLHAGQVFFINGFQISKQYCRKSFKVSWLHFISDSIFLKQALLKFPLATPLNFNKIENVVPIFKLLDSFFKDYSTKHRSITQKGLEQYLKIQSLVSMVIANLAEDSDMDTFYLSGQGSRLFRAIEFMNSNYKNTITLQELASLCFMSENYFHSLFKKEFTVTPNNYILQLRMYEALNLLSNTNLSIKEVASEAGYSDAAYFSRTFSKYFSLSPNKYRSLHRTRTP